MRYLNKIVFINSAHVPYAEIRLNGNVHFIGTQGVGKSTLLRAILFFYNVDKSKLGIRTQDKQKSYDEFYLPYPNSYIIYEVCRETGRFFVMTFSSQGRTAFRIVDCPYRKDFFVEEDGAVRYEWSRISEAIGTKTFKSNIIRGYEEFRNIIYGNVQNVDRNLRRFCLMESAKYENVPRTIQNIFLNQSLESRMIKDTIIDSMDFSNDCIDLNFYREQVKDFRLQYNDIWKWYRRDKSGKVKVQDDANEVISGYTLYEYCQNAITELCANLNYALERDEKQVPLTEQEEAECAHELSRRKRLLDEEADKYNSEFAKLSRLEGAVNAFLDTVKKKRTHYAEIGIEQIQKEMVREDALKTELNSLKQQEAILTDRHRGVKARYDDLLKDAENRLREYRLQAQQRINHIDSLHTTAMADLQAEFNDKQESLRKQYRQKLDSNQADTDNAKQQINELKLKEQKVRQMNPYQAETDELRQRLSDLQERKNKLAAESVSKQQEADRIMAEVELQKKDLENLCDIDKERIAHRIDALAEKISQLDELLGRQKGSLIEWLEGNVDNWENNIGKVLDEDCVLYNNALSPKLYEPTDTVFGIKINTENIDRTIRRPEEVKAEKAGLEKETDALRHQQAARTQKLEDDIAELKRKPATRIKAIRMEKMRIDAELSQTPVLIQNVHKALDRQQEALAQWRKTELAAVMKEEGAAELMLEDLKKKKLDLCSQRDKQLDALRKSFDKQKAGALSQVNADKKEIENEAYRKEQDAEKHRLELLAMMDTELKGLGVDTTQLANIRRQLQAATEALTFIDAHRADYISWLNDTHDFFDKEQEKKEERKSIKLHIDELKSKFDARRTRLDNEIKRLSATLRSIQDTLNRLNDGIRSTRTFIGTPSCPECLATAGHTETGKPLTDIKEELRDKINEQQQRREEFKKAVVQFKSNFSPQNTFHFRTELDTEADYTEFAADLNDFISNNKIEEYRVRTSSQYANIIKRIAREVSDLNRHGTDIRSTINDINKDFRDNNFAGVIKEIELRAVESSDRLMQQLLSIKKFDDENGFNIGQLNLFSNEDDLNRTNKKAVDLLMTLTDLMDAEQKRDKITLADTFKLEFKVRENDNDTSWVERLSNVGSDGTDILVKAIVNIMLINVFKRKISHKFGDFKLHCMMDEIGKLHPNNVEGILKFANVRNIYLINSSPTTYNAGAYRYTYLLSKDSRSNTIVRTLLTIR